MRSRRKKFLTAAAGLAAFACAVTIPSWAQDQSSLAERYLSKLAAKSRRARQVAGGAGLVIGALAIAGGAAMRDTEDDPIGLGEFFGTAAIVGGAGLALGGAASLTFKSGAEKAIAKATAIPDGLEREAACRSALARLARRGRVSRFLAAGIIAAAGIANTMSSSEGESNTDLTPLVTLGGLAAVSLLIKSPAERSYKAFLEESGEGPAPRLMLGLGPRGGFRAGLSLDF